LPPEDLDPKRLIDIVSSHYKRFYYSSNEALYKVLGLYTMMTYYYELFDSIPYLFINGKKGSGKSALGSAYIALFHSKMATEYLMPRCLEDKP
jgi:hypothetical protein